MALLKHFPNAAMLMEKPSHNTAAEAKAFLQEIGSNVDRVYVGFHSCLHPSQKEFLNQVELHKDEVVSVSVKFNYPKNPNDPGDKRCYDENHGGVMLDLGVYVIDMAKNILSILGSDLHQFDQKKKIWIKKTTKNVDVEVEASLVYGGVDVYLESKMNPGVNHTEEVVVTLASGDRIVANQFVHWSDSNGVIIEHPDGSATDICPKNPKSTYEYQIEHIDSRCTSEQGLSIYNSIYLLEFIDMIKQNVTHSNL